MKGERTHYRVIYKREGLNPKAKRYIHRRNAERLVGILTSPEPWTFYRAPCKPDDYVCCSGHECGCGGLTVREDSEQKAKDLPKLEWVRLEQRQVTAWVSAKERSDIDDSKIKGERKV